MCVIHIWSSVTSNNCVTFPASKRVTQRHDMNIAQIMKLGQLVAARNGSSCCRRPNWPSTESACMHVPLHYSLHTRPLKVCGMETSRTQIRNDSKICELRKKEKLRTLTDCGSKFAS